jgi:hypothetical protein
MIIHLTKSKLFNTDPDVRFSQEYELPLGIWKELWRRYKLMNYSTSELCEYYKIKTKKEINNRVINRWVRRSEIYMIARQFTNKGAETVVSSVFGDYEQEVLDELLKQMRWGGKGDSNSIV